MKKQKKCKFESFGDFSCVCCAYVLIKLQNFGVIAKDNYLFWN